MAEHYSDLIRTLMRNGFSFKRQGAGSDEIWWNRASGGEVTFGRNIDSRAAATAVLVNAGIEKAEKPAAKAPAKSAAKAPAKTPAKKAAKETVKAKAPLKKKSAAKQPAKAKAKPAAKTKSASKARARTSKK
jgi:hypothetical protein